MQNRPNSASSISSVLARPVKASSASRAWRNSSAMINGIMRLARMRQEQRSIAQQVPLALVEREGIGWRQHVPTFGNEQRR
jgi:hypothetical protein